MQREVFTKEINNIKSQAHSPQISRLPLVRQLRQIWFTALWGEDTQRPNNSTSQVSIYKSYYPYYS